MKQIKIILVISLILILCACAHRQPAQQYKAPAKAPAISASPNKLFDPGEYPMDSSEIVWKQYNCGAKQLPLIVFESNSLNPSIVSAEQKQINHLLTYAVCSQKNSVTLQGVITGKLYFKDKLIAQNRRNMKLKPGRWSIVAVIPIPPVAKSGTYNLRTEFFIDKKTKLDPLSASFEINR